MKIKMIIAREWLYLVSLSLLGIILTVILYFQNSKDYIRNRQLLYDVLTRHYSEVAAAKSEKTMNNIFDKISKPKKGKNKRVKTVFKIDWSKIRVKENIWDVATASETNENYLGRNGDTTKPLGTFEQFSARLDDHNLRKALYDSASVHFDVGDYQVFESRIVPPSIFSSFSKFYTHSSSKKYWLQTWASALILYLFFQFVRSVIYSIRTLRHK